MATYHIIGISHKEEVFKIEKKKPGRPTDAPKTIVKRARMSAEDVRKLEECCKFYGKNDSEILRMGIEKIYSEVVE